MSRAKPRPTPHGEVRVVGPGFHQRVFSLVRRIPPGRVATYGQLATLLGSPRVARQVGWAMSAIGDAEPPVPWHRVINARGGLSGSSTHAQQQRTRLEAEGVVFRENGTIDLKRFQWCTAPGHDFE